MADIRTLVTVEMEIDGGFHTSSLKVAAGQPILSAIQQAWGHLDIALETLWPLSEDGAKVHGAIVPAATARALLMSVEKALGDAIRDEEQAEFRVREKSKGNGND